MSQTRVSARGISREPIWEQPWGGVGSPGRNRSKHNKGVVKSKDGTKSNHGFSKSGSMSKGSYHCQKTPHGEWPRLVPFHVRELVTTSAMRLFAGPLDSLFLRNVLHTVCGREGIYLIQVSL